MSGQQLLDLADDDVARLVARARELDELDIDEAERVHMLLSLVTSMPYHLQRCAAIVLARQPWKQRRKERRTMHLRQNINQPLAQRLEVLNTTGLVASPFTGSVAIAVLLFAGASTFVGPQGAVAIPSWLTTTNDAAQGTLVRIFQPGVYMAELYVEMSDVGTTDTTFGISADVDVAGLTAVPSFATPGMLGVWRNQTVAGETNVPLELCAPIEVSPDQSIAGVAVRFHATLSAGLAPEALVAGSPGAYFRIRRVNQLHS